MTDTSEVIGVDVGGTTVKAIRVTNDGAELARDTIGTPSDADELTAAVVELITRLRTDRTVAVSVVCPGDVREGTVHFAANLPWHDEPVRERMRAAVALPVSVEWDVAAAALAETDLLDADDVLFVAVGTGIAAAHVVNGAVRRGATGRAGELGHVPVRPGGERCACGQRGCLEAYASAAAIARHYAARTGVDRSAADIAARLDTDHDAAAVWTDAVDALASALIIETLATDPGVIVLGGGLSLAGELLLDPVQAALSAGLAWRPAPPVRAAVLGDSAGLIGAARLARRAHSVADREGCRS